MSRKTSVYLSDEIADGLAELSLNVPQALRIAISAERARREAEQPQDTDEMRLLKAIGQSVVKIQAAVVCDCLGAPRGHLAGATPACSGKTANGPLSPIAAMTPEDTAGISEPVEYYPAAEKAEIHAAHCCKVHGCKYSPDNSDCPVFAQKIAQLYPCEWCRDEENLQRHEEARRE